MIRSASTGRAVRRFSAALVLPVLLATGCGGQPAPVAQPPAQPQANNGTPTVPPTVRTAPSRHPASTAAPTGSDAKTVTLDKSYMPFATGRTWTYNVRSTAAGKTDDGTVTWTVDDAGPDNTAVTVASNVGGQKHTISNKVTKNADGTVTITSTTDGQSQTQTVKPESLPSGDQAQPQGPGAAAQGQAMSGTPESVTVAAGTFEAIKIVNQLPEGKGSITAWYAPNIGMVKQDIQATTEQGPVSSLMELAAFK